MEKPLKEHFEMTTDYGSTLAIYDYLDEMEKYCTFLETENKALALCEVSRSVGKDTKPTLMEMTEKQKKINYVSCLLCKYKENDIESDVCQKCMEENNENQYYG